MAGPFDFPDDGMGYIQRLFQIESGGNPYAVTGSNRGLGQFGPREEAQYGINGQNRADPQAQARAVAMEASQHGPALARVLGRDPTPAELYLAHQQGLAGASALLSNPDLPAWQAIRPYYGSDAVAQKAITGNVYGVPNAGNMTAKQFADYWTNKFQGGAAPEDIPTTQGQNRTSMDEQPSFLDRFAGGLQSPLVQLGLALASGKTPQEGMGNAANATFKISQQSQLDQAKKAAYQAAIAAGATPQQAANLALNPEAFKALQPQFHTLTGMLGEQTPVFVNPFNQTITPVGGGQTSGGQGPVAQNGPNLPESYNDQGKDEAFLKSVEDQYGTTVAKSIKDITEGRMPAMGRNLQKLIPLASRYDQNFTGMQDYQTRLQTAKSFAAGGKDAAAVKSINQAVTHANQIWDLIPKIEGVNVGGMAGKVINGPYGEYRAATDPEFANNRQRYDEIVNALAGELRAASTGSGHGSLEEIRNWKAGALCANSGAEMRGAIQGGMDFLHGAMDATAQKKATGLKSQFQPTDLLSPQNQGLFARIRDYTEGGSKTNAPATAPSNAAPAVQGARKAPDGNWYVPDPNRPGKYLKVVQ